MGGTNYRGLWGKGRLGAVVAGVFLRVGGTKRGLVGRGGGGELAGVGVKSEGLEDPLSRTVSEGAEGALGWDFGGI